MKSQAFQNSKDATAIYRQNGNFSNSYQLMKNLNYYKTNVQQLDVNMKNLLIIKKPQQQKYPFLFDDYNYSSRLSHSFDNRSSLHFINRGKLYKDESTDPNSRAATRAGYVESVQKRNMQQLQDIQHTSFKNESTETQTDLHKFQNSQDNTQIVDMNSQQIKDFFSGIHTKQLSEDNIDLLKVQDQKEDPINNEIQIKEPPEIPQIQDGIESPIKNYIKSPTRQERLKFNLSPNYNLNKVIVSRAANNKSVSKNAIHVIQSLNKDLHDTTQNLNKVGDQNHLITQQLSQPTTMLKSEFELTNNSQQLNDPSHGFSYTNRLFNQNLQNDYMTTNHNQTFHESYSIGSKVNRQNIQYCSEQESLMIKKSEIKERDYMPPESLQKLNSDLFQQLQNNQIAHNYNSAKHQKSLRENLQRMNSIKNKNSCGIQQRLIVRKSVLNKYLQNEENQYENNFQENNTTTKGARSLAQSSRRISQSNIQPQQTVLSTDRSQDTDKFESRLQRFQSSGGVSLKDDQSQLISLQKPEIEEVKVNGGGHMQTILTQHSDSLQDQNGGGPSNLSNTSIEDQLQAERLLEENLKLARKLKDLESQLLRQSAMNQSDTQNNTSSGFELPSEFKNRWEILVKDLIMDAFGDFFDQINILIALVQFSFSSVKIVINDALNEKFNNVIQLFNLKTNDKTQEDLQVLLKPFLKNNYKEIFNDESLSERFLYKFNEYLKNGYFNDDEQQQICDMISDNKKAIESYFNHVKVICLYMQINEPQIVLQDIKLPRDTQSKMDIQFMAFHSELYSIIDGFEKEGSPCIVVINQPKIGNGSFAGIKPATIVLNKVPQGYNQKLVDHQQQVEQSRHRLIEQGNDILSKSNSYVDTSSRIYKEIIQTPRQSDNKTFVINLENQRKHIQLQNQPPSVILTIERLPKIHGESQNNIQINHINEESDESISRDINLTEADILNDLDYNKINNSKNLELQKTPVQDVDNSKILSALSDYSPIFQDKQRQKVEKPSTGLSRNNSQNNNHSFCQETNRSFENIYHNQVSTTKNSMKKQLRKHKNQSLYENLSHLEKGNFQGSRFIQCSLNFQKFLRNQTSNSPNPKAQPQIKHAEIIHQTMNSQKKVQQTPQTTAVSRLQNNSQRNETSNERKHERSIVQSNHYQKKNTMKDQKNYDSQGGVKTNNNMRGMDLSIAKKRRDTLNAVSNAFNHHQQPEKKKPSYQQQLINKQKKDQSQNCQDSMTSQKEKQQKCKTRVENISVSRYSKAQHSQVDKRKPSPIQERILKQGSVLKRKPSVNPISSKTILKKENDMSQTLDNRVPSSQQINGLNSCTNIMLQNSSFNVTSSRQSSNILNSHSMNMNQSHSQIHSPRGGFKVQSKRLQ
eukprot:403334904